MTKTDLKTYGSLSIVTINGYKPTIDGAIVDRPGDANWLCDQYGMIADNDDCFDPEDSGIIWADYDTIEGRPWQFSVLIDSREVESLVKQLEEAEYDLVSVEAVAEPCNYGDGHAGTVVILKHPEGWVVIS